MLYKLEKGVVRKEEEEEKLEQLSNYELRCIKLATSLAVCTMRHLRLSHVISLHNIKAAVYWAPYIFSECEPLSYDLIPIRLNRLLLGSFQ